MNKESTRDKIRGLLNKAKNTPYPEEAAAFFDKATQLMARYSITESMLVEQRSDFVSKVEMSCGKYYSAKHSLAIDVSRSFGCHLVRVDSRGPDRSIVGIIGFESDLEMLEDLLQSLFLQLDTELIPVTGYNTRTARANFAYGWCAKVGERVKAYYRAAVDEYEAETGNSTALVLVDKDAQVLDWAERMYGYKPRYTHSSSLDINWDAQSYGAGQTAGEKADIGQARFEESRGALPA